jgi:hypothetical protein
VGNTWLLSTDNFWLENLWSDQRNFAEIPGANQSKNLEPSALNEHLIIALPMIHFDGFQFAGFKGCVHVVSICVDPLSQLDLHSTSATDQLINMVSVDQPGAPGFGENSITHGKSPLVC